MKRGTAMLAFANFIQPFLDYLRPTKSPYLVLMFACVSVLCLSVYGRPPAQADRPEVMLVIYCLMGFIVFLSLREPVKVKQSGNAESNLTVALDQTINNAKYENDFDAVMKFSRALNLACPIILLYFYLDTRLQGFFSVVGYLIILAQMLTFMTYIWWRHFHDEEGQITLNTFQIAFITATLFVGATYTGLKLTKDKEAAADIWETAPRLFVYCRDGEIIFKDHTARKIVNHCPSANNASDFVRPQDVERIRKYFAIDYNQISFLILSALWFVYELFWLRAVKRAVFAFAYTSKRSGRLSLQSADTRS
jgi:hypothetical protein